MAGERAGPIAAKAAGATAEAGVKLAERSREVASELRRAAPAAPAGDAADAGSATPSGDSGDKPPA